MSACVHTCVWGSQAPFPPDWLSGVDESFSSPGRDGQTRPHLTSLDEASGPSLIPWPPLLALKEF